ncbi:Dihydrofolate reductase [Raineyella antarctica]|uniref:Dihydrofolate reductase n=1 Tax=Raineyella antarctica TaxID=1577474 RepID=A0A1G6GDQ6_9ACTN|nr:dihydrofolate reductase family protein [Raineyella antarctica]SDB80142.1 Dihydrofolate reductase [Raineyella antarctica]
MRFVYYTASTLNGFLADPDNSLAWLFAVDSPEPDVSDVLDTVTVSVMGSTTYEWVLDHEDLLAHPEKWEASFLGVRSVVVFSSRELPVPAGAGVRVVSGPVRDHLAEIEAAADGGDVWVVGGGDLAGQFLDAGLLDRIVVAVAPAALRGGAPLLPRDVMPDRLELVSAEAAGQFAMLRYRVRPGDQLA